MQGFKERFLTRHWLGERLGRWLAFRYVEPDSLALLPDVATFYVLPTVTATDHLALNRLTQELKLPRSDQPVTFAGTSLPPCLTMDQADSGANLASATLTGVLGIWKRQPSQDAQLVPVSLFWDRAPPREERQDSVRHGSSRRLLAFIINGRHLEAHLGEPVRLGLRDDGKLGDTLYAELASHFQRVEARVIGPALAHRPALIQKIVESERVVAAEKHQCQQEGTTSDSPRQLSERYARELAANPSYPAMRCLYELLKRLWNQLYEGVDILGLEPVKARAADTTLIYVPCHRSHIDYLLLSYALYREGLTPPHIAAGQNLDMPLIGPLLRRGGAFFMRRSFKDDPLYTAVFNDYLHHLLVQGHALEYFIEGGRSRTGRLLPHRRGMLAMTLSAFLKESPRDITFVPVYIDYEKILENDAYIRERRGEPKPKESPLALLGAMRHLRNRHGRVTLSFGEPLSLSWFLEAHAPQVMNVADDASSREVDAAADRLGKMLTQRINAAARLNAVSLVAMVLTGPAPQTLDYATCVSRLACLGRLQRTLPGGDRCPLPHGKPESWIDRARELGFLDIQPQASGKLIVTNTKQAARLTWYRNNVTHLFVHFGLVALALRHRTRLTLDVIDARASCAWPFLAQELSLAEPKNARQRVGATLSALKGENLIHTTQGGSHCRTDSRSAQATLNLLSQSVEPTLIRTYLIIATLLRSPVGTWTRGDLESHGHQLTYQFARDNDWDVTDFAEGTLCKGVIDTLQRQGWTRLEDEHLVYDGDLIGIARQGVMLFDEPQRRQLNAFVGMIGPARPENVR